MMNSLTSLSSNITMQDPWIHQASMNISFVHGRSINPERLWRIWGYQLSFYHLVGGLEHKCYVSIYWEFHHPNWRSPSFFRGVGIENQPVIVWRVPPMIFIHHGWSIRGSTRCWHQGSHEITPLLGGELPTARKWVITPVINGISRVNPLKSLGWTTHLRFVGWATK